MDVPLRLTPTRDSTAINYQLLKMRTFQYQDEKSSKFWNISLEDCTHTVNYGKSGTSGRTQSKSFETAEEAKKSYDKLIEQKIKKGYLEEETAT